MDFYHLHKKKLIIAVVALVAVVAAALGGWLVFGGSSKGNVSAEERAWKERKPEAIVKVNPSKQEAILPGASHAPVTQIQAFGPCKTALDEVRNGVMKAYPSGLALDAAGSERLTKGFGSIDKQCPADVAANFRSKEMMVWNNSAVPVRAGETPKK